MEINTVYSNAKYTGLFSNRRLEKLLAQLEEKFEVNAVECASVLNDRTVDMRVAFACPTKVRAEVSEEMAVDREGYSWVRFAKFPQGGDWIIAFKREDAAYQREVEAYQREWLAGIEATA